MDEKYPVQHSAGFLSLNFMSVFTYLQFKEIQNVTVLHLICFLAELINLCLMLLQGHAASRLSITLPPIMLHSASVTNIFLHRDTQPTAFHCYRLQLLAEWVRGVFQVKTSSQLFQLFRTKCRIQFWERGKQNAVCSTRCLRPVSPKNYPPI